MKALVAASFFVLLAAVPAAFADHPAATVSMPEGTGVPGCQETDECFVPSEVWVGVGGSVTWTNDDSVIHLVAAGDPREDPDMVGFDYPNGFDSGLVNQGDQFTVEDLREGTYPYFCQVHPWMLGTLYVTESHDQRERAPVANEDDAEEVLPAPANEESVPYGDTVISMPEGTGVPGCQETDECFVPSEVWVDAGSSVTWTNDDSVLHFVAAGNLQEDRIMVGLDFPNGFDSGLMNPGDHFTAENLKEGTYPYFCQVHPWMIGTLHVGESGYKKSPAADDGRGTKDDAAGAKAKPAVTADADYTAVTIPRGTGVPGCEAADECFVPAEASVGVGDTVAWTNDDNVVHMIHAGDLAADPSKVGLDFPNGFDSGLMMSGDTFERTFYDSGDYPNYCSLHPWMTGTLHVGEAGAERKNPVADNRGGEPANGGGATYEHPEFSLALPGAWESQAGGAALAAFHRGDPWDMYASVNYVPGDLNLVGEMRNLEWDCLWSMGHSDGYACSDFEWISTERTDIDGKRAYILSAEYTKRHYQENERHRMMTTTAIVEGVAGTWSVYTTADAHDRHGDELRSILYSFRTR